VYKNLLLPTPSTFFPTTLNHEPETSFHLIPPPPHSSPDGRQIKARSSVTILLNHDSRIETSAETAAFWRQLRPLLQPPGESVSWPPDRSELTSGCRLREHGGKHGGHKQQQRGLPAATVGHLAEEAPQTITPE